jgi:CPA2 family monovalent cation:H+ antiporter-2
MHTNVFLSDLATVMLAAGATTVLFRWLRQPVVLGYILAGLLIGPHLLPRPLIADQESIRTLAELGLIFLLFFLGLEFNFPQNPPDRCDGVHRRAARDGLMFFAGFEIGRLFGWATMDCVYLGAVMMISSTTIITKTLADLGRTREKFAEVIFGILIAEDIIAILTIASLSTLAAEGGLAMEQRALAARAAGDFSRRGDRRGAAAGAAAAAFRGGFSTR